MNTKLSIQEMNAIIACPRCKCPIFLLEGQDASCHQCQENYRWLSGTWDIIPSSYRSSSNLWPAWQQLQANGLVSYKQDPDHNLAVGEREDCLQFSRFCGFDGLVLDVGCGPQPLPAYFRFRSARTRFVGIDPLIQGPSANYFQVRALSEFLPFRNQTFDHVIFATSLDHIIDPAQALIEARRVCQLSAEIDIWNGEKRSNTPEPAVTNEWYMGLKKPEGAEDLFHLRRLRSTDMNALFKQVGFNLVEEQVHRIDEYRSNFFYRLKVG